jgi:DNA-binding beta-propeller fold protein YncE
MAIPSMALIRGATRIVVFDLATGEQTQSIGTHGTGPGELAQPRGIAVTDRGDVIVVDTLNNRVRVFAPDGEWLRDIGGPGYTPGSFGRPRDVAIGPDGTVFVSDAFSQRIHAFTAEGQPLLAFGTPGSGLGALALPLGVAVTTAPLPTTEPLPAGRTAAYYVLVAEQLRGPGIRVYAWLAGNREAAEGQRVRHPRVAAAFARDGGTQSSLRADPL